MFYLSAAFVLLVLIVTTWLIIRRVRGKKVAGATPATSTTSDEDGPANVVPDPELYRVLFYCGIVAIVTMTVVTGLLWGSLFFGDYFDGGQTALIFLMMYILLSFKEIRANEVGAAFCYGKALQVLPSGLHFVPLWLMQIKKGPRTVQEFQCPGEPEKVQKTGDEVPLKEGMVRPIRVVTGGPHKDKTGDFLNTRMTLSLSFFVQWAITDVLDYTSNYGDSALVEKQVRDIGEAILAETAVNHSPASFIDDLLAINALLAQGMDERFENSGVHIIAARLISPDISRGVSIALANIPTVRAEAEQAKVKSEGEKTKLTNEGAGRSAARLSMLTAEAEGRKKMMDALGVDGDAVLASEAVNGILDKTDVLVMGQGGATDAMGLVKAAQSALNSSKTKGVKP